MTRRLVLGYLGLTLLVLLALEVPLGIQNSRTERRNLEAKVQHDATNLASIAQDALETGSKAQLAAVAAIAYRYSSTTGGRVLVVGRNGVAVVDTRPSGSAREGFVSRPEISAALHGRVAQGVRHSSTLHQNLLYVAVPVAAGGAVRRRGSDHLPDVGGRCPDQPLLADPARDRARRPDACSRGRHGDRRVRDPSAAEPRTGRRGGR